MITLPVLDSHAPPVRVMALHALAYCPRLFYLEEVEEIRVADARVYAGRELHASLAADEEREALAWSWRAKPSGWSGRSIAYAGAIEPPAAVPRHPVCQAEWDRRPGRYTRHSLSCAGPSTNST